GGAARCHPCANLSATPDHCRCSPARSCIRALRCYIPSPAFGLAPVATKLGFGCGSDCSRIRTVMVGIRGRCQGSWCMEGAEGLGGYHHQENRAAEFLPTS